MRKIALIPLVAMVMGSSAPVPILARAPAGEAAEAEQICRPFLEAARSEDGPSYPVPLMVAPTPPPPAPPPPPSPVVSRQSTTVADAISAQDIGALPDQSVTGAMQRIPGVSVSAVVPPPMENRERYAGKEVAKVTAVADAPVSTFGVDVDTGSYSNVRRMLRDGELPPQAAVRTEEMLNYFRYDYPAPKDRARPFTVNADITTTPWNPATRLMRIGLRGYDLPRAERPPANLVFLVDVSGSMDEPDKLPLVKCSLALLAHQLKPADRVSIVVYAGAAGLVLAPTSDRRKIIAALSRLDAGGSTAGAEGIKLAYQTARAAMRKDGINRVILATDGDFNVGVTNDDALIDMVEREREAGITLTTLGFGEGNYNEAMMEQVADRGNGNYAYIDGPLEARKVLQQELSSTLFTIAKDVKIQVEFNPAYVSEYRLIGYENRALAEQDFDNDAVDAGDIGAGHQVTALYEIVPAGSRGWLPDRHYAANKVQANGTANGEFAWLRLRYKLPSSDTSQLIEQPLAASLIGQARAPTGDLAFVAAVAGFAQKLRGDPYLGKFGYADAERLGRKAGSGDYWRREFAELAGLAARTDAKMAAKD